MIEEAPVTLPSMIPFIVKHTSLVSRRFGRTARIRFRGPQRAITPGQPAVFYSDDRVLGVGWIC